MSSVFNDEQFNQIYPDGIEKHFWTRARNNIIYRFICSNHLQNGIMIEIGGGRGVVTKFLHDKGLSCTGFESAPVNPLKGISDIFFTGKDALNLPDEVKQGVRLILLFDVIEHMEFPEDFFEKIAEHFPNCEYILITVPAGPELWTNYDIFNGHYKRYTMQSLKSAGSQRVVYKKGLYFNHILYPVFLFYAKWIGKRKTKISAPRGLNIFIHRILSLLLLSDFRIFPGTWRGTSLIAMFKIVQKER